MWIFILAIAAAAQPQATTMQGNGHHANDARRTQEEQSENQPIHGQEAQPDDRALGERSGPEEDRNADGALMPGAPGTNNPTIPDDA
ncbi:hypothetical protein AYR46_14440 [Sphingobium yanoikuyae]|uniref:hypothetical protein n=1 Tax=Sphingobium yanoikuyae TaxID=13690 RepID=UPI0007A75A82|nr:hypothetical protein [Sphingobium yanoikuyae]KZC79077.1 hypothetical protein AYR46_14440 [Sphingobium yanoikuyae]